MAEPLGTGDDRRGGALDFAIGLVAIVGGILILVFLIAESSEIGFVDGAYLLLALITFVVTLVVEVVLLSRRGASDAHGSDRADQSA